MPKKTKRRYSDDEKAVILSAVDANGGNVKGTCDILGLPHETVTYWANGNVHPDVAKLRNDKKLPIADRLEQIAHDLLDQVPDKYGDANLQQAMTSVAIAIDKMRLLREQPTTISQKAEPDDAELLGRLHRLAERIKASQSVADESGGTPGTSLPAAPAGEIPAADAAGPVP